MSRPSRNYMVEVMAADGEGLEQHLVNADRIRVSDDGLMEFFSEDSPQPQAVYGALSYRRVLDLTVGSRVSVTVVPPEGRRQ